MLDPHDTGIRGSESPRMCRSRQAGLERSPMASPLQSSGTALEAPSLEPIEAKRTLYTTLCSCISALLVVVLVVPLVIAMLLTVLLVWAASTALCIGPLLEARMARRDAKLLEREALLQAHPTLVAVPVAAGLNAAAGRNSYTVVARVTRPPPGLTTGTANPNLPPVIFPGGLAATQIFMARAQDQLTAAGHVTVAVSVCAERLPSHNSMLVIIAV